MHVQVRPAAVLLLVLLCGIQSVDAVENRSIPRRLTGRQEAVARVKRQESNSSPFCEAGYFQCPIEFGGGCCMNGRQCATSDCPALGLFPSEIPHAMNPTPVWSNVPSNYREGPAPTGVPTNILGQILSYTYRPSYATSKPQTASTSTSTSSKSGTKTSDGSAEAMRTGSSTASPTPVASGYKKGVTKGAVVGIVIAVLLGVAIVFFALWRFMLIKRPRRPLPTIGGGSGPPPGPGGLSHRKTNSKPTPVMVFGKKPTLAMRLNPFAKKPNWIEEQEKQSQSRSGRDSTQPLTESAAPTAYDAPPATRGLRGDIATTPITPGLGSAGLAPSPHERQAFIDDDEDEEHRGGHARGREYERSYRSVESYDDEDDMDQRSLFGGAGDRGPTAPQTARSVPEGVPSTQNRPYTFTYGPGESGGGAPGFPER